MVSGCLFSLVNYCLTAANFFPTVVSGSGHFHLFDLAGLGHVRVLYMVRVLGSVYHNRFPYNCNLNHNHILTIYNGYGNTYINSWFALLCDLKPGTPHVIFVFCWTQR